ncbi:SDR family NAD(P)-dependent oxidoreductase [Actinopolymorpha singaporensis]
MEEPPTRTALVTGASRGLGLLVARELARRGYSLVLCARTAEDLYAARDDLTARGADVLAVPCDVRNAQEVEHLVARAIGYRGGLDVVVNVAGIIQVGPLESVTLDEFRDALDTMCLGPVQVTLAALPHLRERRSGRIINVTSIGGKVAVPHILPYSVAKFGAVGFSEGLRAELAGSGISVTTVVPGLMRTGSHVRASFAGQSTKEYGWFSAAASAPLLSMDAERAARRIVAAGLAGRAEVTLTPAAILGARLAGLMPGTTSRLLGLVRPLLPGPPADAGQAVAEPGYRAQARTESRVLRALTTMGRAAAQRFNQRRATGT